MCARHFTWDGASFFTRDYTWAHERGLDVQRLGGEYEAGGLVRRWLAASGVEPECDECLYKRVDDLYAIADARAAAVEEMRREEARRRPARLQELRDQVEEYVRSNGHGHGKKRIGLLLKGWPVQGSSTTQGGYRGSEVTHLVRHVLGDDGLFYPYGRRSEGRPVKLEDEHLLRQLPGFPSNPS